MGPPTLAQHVLIDENLTWNPHINYIKSKISRAIFAINKVKNILPRSALKSLYYSMVHCHLIYGLLAWGKSKSLDKIFKLQKGQSDA
jgi:hypothetical protein